MDMDTHEITTHEISCGRINSIRENMAEVIFNEGVELNAKYTEEVHDFLNSNFKAPISVLNNMVNRHSYSFYAQTMLWAIPEIKWVGFVAYNMIAERSVEVFLLAPRENALDAKIFNNRAEAIQWLDI